MDVLHMAMSIARGHRWMGFRTRPSNVLLIEGEGSKVAMRNRVSKYCAGTKSIYLATPGDVPAEANRADKIAYPTNVFIDIVQYLHLDEQAGVGSLRRKIDSVISVSPANPLVVIIDPLYKMFHHNLVVAAEVNYFTENMDLLLYDYNSIKDGFQRQLALVFVHHSRKASLDTDGNKISVGSDESFGAKQINWWSDTVINSSLLEKDRTRTTVQLQFTKHGRDAEKELPEKIIIRWDRGTLHPRILSRAFPSYPDDDIELRGDALLSSLE
jgi:RecA-family ATPase